MAVPRYVPACDADRVFALPAGVTEAWLSAGYVKPRWFVTHGTIVRGVAVADMRLMVDRRRAYHMRRRAASVA